MIADTASSFTCGRMGSYRIVRLIGQGATSRVYLAHHIFLHRPTAIKVLTCDFAEWPDFDLEIFERTAVSAARLHHPNVVTLYDIDEVRARPYLLMEYVEGASLHEVLRRRGPLPLPRAFSILWEVALALAHAHSAGIVHCDIKPGNILIDRRGTAKVTDFGLSQALNRVDRSPFEGMVAGTPEYISPEQLLGQRPDQRSDLYSLGVTLLEMLTGESPFRGPTQAATFENHLEASRGPLLRRLPAGPLMDIVANLIARHPRNRYASARELLADLRPLKSALKASPKPHDIHAALLRLGRLRCERS
jgi:eukaryotic-like serine/threonine-protein kinase